MHSDWVQHATAELERGGHRVGGARGEVVRLLGDQHCCLTAQDIFDRLRAGGRPVGLASVYRALELLTTLRLVHRVDLDGTAAFEPVRPGGEHHHHARCEGCGELAAFADDALEDLIDRIGERLGYRLEGHDVVLHGVCPDCSAGRG